ncbi:PREDICTED: acrosin-like [Ficedula albicollis]|uniref:Peptidase S1 domain-containing protein n=1 Tax=Ficedula albicollis TaxID=59894 RepID=U3K7Q2_FICAL|nr:PREDICTED: acrosin-like [Ficedula albicollis]
MALLGLLVLLALAWPVGATWDTCRGTCGLRPLASDHSSTVLNYDSETSAQDTSSVEDGPGAQAGAWPGIVSIQATYENGTWHMCTGVLFSSQWVLTVAHCFARAGAIATWEVVMGATDLTQPGPEAEVRHIQRLLVHQHYVPSTARNDIALLELDQPVECSDYIQLGCVPDASLRVSELKSCYIAGWNFARAQGAGMVLQESKVHLMDMELCNSSPWYAGAVHADDLCAGYPDGGIDTCQTGLSPAERAGPAPEPIITVAPEQRMKPQEPEEDINLSPEYSQRPVVTSSGTSLPEAFPCQIVLQFWNVLQELLQFLKDKKP